MLMQASRNRYFFVLHRVDGKNLSTTPFGPVNWSLGVDKRGRRFPILINRLLSMAGRLAPTRTALPRPPSFDPKTGLLIVDAHPSYSIFTFPNRPMELMRGQGITTTCGARASLRPLTTTQAGFAGATRSVQEQPGRGFDDGFGTYIHWRCVRQFSCALYEQRQDALACRLWLAHRKRPNHLPNRW